jgi:hypothetical protein
MPKRKFEDVEDLENFTDMPSGLEETIEPAEVPEEVIEPPAAPHPFEGCSIWGSWRGSPDSWWEVASGKLIRIPNAHALHPTRKRFDHLPGNIIPPDLELA